MGRMHGRPPGSSFLPCSFSPFRSSALFSTLRLLLGAAGWSNARRSFLTLVLVLALPFCFVLGFSRPTFVSLLMPHPRPHHRRHRGGACGLMGPSRIFAPTPLSRMPSTSSSGHHAFSSFSFSGSNDFSCQQAGDLQMQSSSSHWTAWVFTPFSSFRRTYFLTRASHVSITLASSSSVHPFGNMMVLNNARFRPATTRSQGFTRLLHACALFPEPAPDMVSCPSVHHARPTSFKNGSDAKSENN